MTLKKKIFIPLMLSIGILLSIPTFAGDPPPVGGDPSGISSGATPIGGSAPIGNGLILIIGMGLAYASYKTLKLQEDKI